MANQWLRLWHDMPTDPKWRTIAKASGQRIGDVMAVYVHLLVCASNATERGRTQSFNCEDVASALDLETEQVELIHKAMQGRVLDGETVAGWEKRQVAREDGSAERSKAWREAQKLAAERIPNAGDRNRAPDKDTDKDTDKEKKKRVAAPPPDGVSVSVWQDFLKTRKTKFTDTALDGIRKEAAKAGVSLEDALRESCARGWQSFKAKWVLDPKQVVGVTAPPPANADAALKKIKEDDAKAAPMPAAERAKWDALRRGSTVPRETPQGAH